MLRLQTIEDALNWLSTTTLNWEKTKTDKAFSRCNKLRIGFASLLAHNRLQGGKVQFEKHSSKNRFKQDSQTRSNRGAELRRRRLLRVRESIKVKHESQGQATGRPSTLKMLRTNRIAFPRPSRSSNYETLSVPVRSRRWSDWKRSRLLHRCWLHRAEAPGPDSEGAARTWKEDYRFCRFHLHLLVSLQAAVVSNGTPVGCRKMTG